MKRKYGDADAAGLTPKCEHPKTADVLSYGGEVIGQQCTTCLRHVPPYVPRPVQKAKKKARK